MHRSAFGGKGKVTSAWAESSSQALGNSVFLDKLSGTDSCWAHWLLLVPLFAGTWAKPFSQALGNPVSIGIGKLIGNDSHWARWLPLVPLFASNWAGSSQALSNSFSIGNLPGTDSELFSPALCITEEVTLVTLLKFILSTRVALSKAF